VAIVHYSVGIILGFEETFWLNMKPTTENLLAGILI